MAEKRMFSNKVVGSGRFLRMPPTCRLLYYDLGMAADDDGVVEAYGVIKTTGASEDDLRVLVAKEFVRILNEDLVTQIMDWKTNNTIRSDRYHQGLYAALISDNQSDNQLSTNCQPSDNQMTPEVKIKIKDKVKTKDYKFIPPTIEEVRAYCQERNNNVDPEKWYAHYEAVGWKVGKNPMRNWKAAVRTWEEKKEVKVEYTEFIW